MNPDQVESKVPDPKRKSHKPAVVLVVVMALLYLVVTRPAPSLEDWGRDYSRAVEEASSTGRNVLILFSLENCPPCSDMKRHVLTKRSVVAALRDFVPIELSLVRDVDVAQRFSAQAAPTFLIVDPDGRVLKALVGTCPVDEFLAFLKVKQ